MLQILLIFLFMNKIVLLILFVLLTPVLKSQGILHTSGNKITDQSGHQVILRGVNLGGWLVTEDWMCGITDTTDNGGRSAQKTLETLYTPTQVDTLIKRWEDNWITSADIDTIKSLGFNFMRVPFGWRNLQDQNQHWYLDTLGNIDFTRFDWIVTQAAQRNMYVLFDYHIWLNQDLAYNGISGTDSVIQSTCRIWKAVASHFNNNPTVAGYDMLNEPTSSAGEYVKQMIYDTIRSVDSAHIVSIEWTTIDTSRWHNVLYQDHWYGLTASTLDSNQMYFDTHYIPILKQADSLGVPYYIGETQVPQDSSYAWSLNEYCLHNTNWSPWSYKTINEWGWGMISLYPNNVSVNLFTSPYDTILSRWSHVSNANNWYELQNVKTIWSNAARCVNTSNGLQNIAESNLRVTIYPNPANSLLHLSCVPSLIGSPYTITNTLGKLICGGQISSENQQINIEEMPDGIYILRIGATQGISVRFVKD